ncbi:MAG TPA: alpha/beta fold hydrolase [Terriglobales bacterium]|jgi:dienelactone hydrolase|nr:alpha/beta fold hydrolase [Terriglobales bacterium]
MNRLLLVFVISASVLAISQSAQRDIDLTVSDGTHLKATFYAAKAKAKSAPAVILLHMCNTDRKSWTPVAEQLAATGITALTIDNRGFGESEGPRWETASPEVRQQTGAKWPGDFDTAFAWLLSQPGIDKNRIGGGGGSCGVNNVVKLASRHPEIRSLVLLAGPTDSAGINFLRQHAWIPLFTAAAADDQYSSEAPQLMRWFAEVTGNPRNKFVAFKDGRHGTEIFAPHPELPRQIVAFYEDTVAKNPANTNAKVTPKTTPASQFWAVASQAGGATRAAEIFHETRKRDAKAFLFPESIVNVLGYERLQAAGVIAGANFAAENAAAPTSPPDKAQAKTDALTLFKLNAEAYPESANAQDSLADAYLANGQDAEALAAEQKCLELLPNDKANDQFKAQLRQAAEQKIAKLKESKGGE